MHAGAQATAWSWVLGREAAAMELMLTPLVAPPSPRRKSLMPVTGLILLMKDHLSSLLYLSLPQPPAGFSSFALFLHHGQGSSKQRFPSEISSLLSLYLLK
jgi:hypothetical protein